MFKNDPFDCTLGFWVRVCLRSREPLVRPAFSGGLERPKLTSSLAYVLRLARHPSPFIFVFPAHPADCPPTAASMAAASPVPQASTSAGHGYVPPRRRTLQTGSQAHPLWYSAYTAPVAAHWGGEGGESRIATGERDMAHRQRRVGMSTRVSMDGVTHDVAGRAWVQDSILMLRVLPLEDLWAAEGLDAMRGW